MAYQITHVATFDYATQEVSIKALGVGDTFANVLRARKSIAKSYFRRYVTLEKMTFFERGYDVGLHSLPAPDLHEIVYCMSYKRGKWTKSHTELHGPEVHTAGE